MLDLIFLICVGSVVAAAAAYLGSFMVLKRMSLVGDALSHVALPGMALALTLNLNPMLGAFVALTIAIIGIWYLAERSEVYPEALVGVFFTASLAIGILITPEPELFEALFGNLEKITLAEGLAVVAISGVLFIITTLIAKKLLIGVVSEDLAKSVGVSTRAVNLIYLLLVGTVVALGVKFVGTLLTGALVVVPAVAAKNLAKSIAHFHIFAILLAALSAVIGILAAVVLGLPAGPLVVLASVLLFAISFIPFAVR